MGEPLPIDLQGNLAIFDDGATNVSVRCGVDQAEKLRACDGLRRNTVNIYCAVWAPIKLPTWGKISQLCLTVKTSDQKWAFFKADHQADYKQLPMAPEHRQHAMVALRDPKTSAVLH